MEVGEGELIRRKILRTLKTRGDYISMVTLCEKAKIARGAVPSILHALIGRGYVKNNQDAN
jgi:DNA-binding IclR family transcriptional regulator